MTDARERRRRTETRRRGPFLRRAIRSAACGAALAVLTPVRAGADAAAPASAPATNGAMVLSIGQAVAMALENNRALSVQRIGPAIRRTYEDEERAAFDPVVRADLAAEAGTADRLAGTGGLTRTEEQVLGAGLSVSKRTAIGTELDGAVSVREGRTDPPDDTLASTRLGLKATQPLLSGFGTDANRVRIRQARLDTAMSVQQFRGFAEALVAQVESAYWDLGLAGEQVRIVEAALAVAEQFLAQVAERIRVGRLAETERAAAEAEVALRRESLINARGAEATARLNLARLVSRPGAALGDTPFVLATRPDLPDLPEPSADAHVRHALRARPDLTEARLLLDRGDLDVRRTRNGLLPRLDFFVTLGLTGYADAVPDTWDRMDGDTFDGSAGLALEYPVGRRRDAAAHRRAQLGREQAGLALENACQLAEVSVRSACIEVARSREQVAATQATRRLQEEKARTEMAKFAVGKSTSLLLAQADRDLLAARIGEARAVVTYLKAWVDLFRQDGSLLTRRGVEVVDDGGTAAPAPPAE